ncbi:hypothetical protein PZ740_10480, partial [Rhodospirillales bacterium YIM 152171]|nr:hypothetical protein [Marinimicrococcus flavescens]
ALTAAAIGNTLSGTGAGNIADIDLEQLNIEGDVGDGFDGQGAVIILEEVGIGGLESTLSAAAIGNSASLTAGTIGTSDDFDTVFQGNYGNQVALIDINEIAVLPTETGAIFDATAAALGNSLTLDAETGDLFVDDLSQINVGDENFDGYEIYGYSVLEFGQYAHIDIFEINDFDAPATPVGVDAPTFETFDSTLVAAAIGNSASLNAGGGILLDTIVQQNGALQEADLELDDVYGLGNLTATAVAIGNSLSITAGGDIAFDKIDGGITQVNDPDYDTAQDVDFDLDDLGVDGDLALTAAAIGNSLSITADGGFELGVENTIEQLNHSAQDSEIELKEMAGVGDLSATVVAIGNSLSITSGGDFSFGTDGVISQLNDNEYGQDAEIELEDELNGSGAVDFTIAAIGNSLSIDAAGTLSGIDGGIVQLNQGEYGQDAEIELDDFDGMGDFASLDATVVAIGNSLSLSAGSFGGTGMLTIAQNNLAPQLVSIELADSGLGALSATTAAIGNSASVTIK